MKTRVYNNDSYILPDDIGLSERFLNAFGVKDGDFVDVKIDGGKMIISRREIRCKISAKELDEAIEAMRQSMNKKGWGGDFKSTCDLVRRNGIESFLAALDIKVED